MTSVEVELISGGAASEAVTGSPGLGTAALDCCCGHGFADHQIQKMQDYLPYKTNHYIILDCWYDHITVMIYCQGSSIQG